MRSKYIWAAMAALAVAVSVCCYFIGWKQTQLWVVGITVIPSLAFIWMYATDGWERSWFGRSLMMLAVSVLGVTLATMLFRSVGDYPGRGFLNVAATTGILASMIIRTLVLWRIKRDEKLAIHLKNLENLP